MKDVSKMNQPKVSVIVPVYNVVPYVERCAISLFEQRLNDFEILFVDDCGQDNSVAISEKEIIVNICRRLCE